jgi:hypothetical protein
LSNNLKAYIMKKAFISLIVIIIMSVSATAQYRINKTNYNYRDYSHQAGDRYSPTGAGIESFFLPGLGQMIAGEGVRGVVFLTGATGCMVLLGIGMTNAYTESTEATGGGLYLAGLLGYMVVDIWSIVDAVRVAKVNNLAYRDKKSTSLNFKIEPYISTEYYNKNGSVPMGLTLKVRF